MEKYLVAKVQMTPEYSALRQKLRDEVRRRGDDLDESEMKKLVDGSSESGGSATLLIAERTNLMAAASRIAKAELPVTSTSSSSVQRSSSSSGPSLRLQRQQQLSQQRIESFSAELADHVAYHRATQLILSPGAAAGASAVAARRAVNFDSQEQKMAALSRPVHSGDDEAFKAPASWLSVHALAQFLLKHFAPPSPHMQHDGSGGQSLWPSHVRDLASLDDDVVLAAFARSSLPSPPTAQDLRGGSLAFLNPSRPQSGIDDRHPDVVAHSVATAAGSVRADKCRTMLFERATPKSAVAEFALQGLPAALRRDAYARLLDVPLKAISGAKYVFDIMVARSPAGSPLSRSDRSNGSAAISLDRLTATTTTITAATAATATSTSRSTWLSEVAEDLRETVGNSDQYFVFLDELQEAAATVCARGSTGGTVNALPPFRGVGFRWGPLGFLTTVPAEIAALHSGMNETLWRPLLDGDAWSLLRVCATFESLLAELAPVVNLHVRLLGVQPLQIALPWMVAGFSGYVAPAEVLALWDRLLALAAAGELDGGAAALLALCAVSLFVVRAGDLLRSRNELQVRSALDDLERVPLLAVAQWALWCQG